jgi:hypothetical protein
MDNSYIHSSKSRFSTFITSYSVRSGRTNNSNSVGMGIISSPPQTHIAQPTPSRQFTSSPLRYSHSGHKNTTGNDSKQGDLGTLRPDEIASYSHIRHATPEQNSGKSSIESHRMIIKKRTEWDVDFEPYPVFPGRAT